MQIVAVGPVLGSLDSPDVEIRVFCTTKGFRLAATLTRFAPYSGGVLKNVLRRPEIRVAAILLRPEIAVEVEWRIRDSNGMELRHAKTPGYVELSYPITVSMTVRD